MLINAETLRALTLNFQTIFNDAFEGAPSDWDKIAMEVPSTTRSTNYGWMGKTTRFREWLGDRVLQNLSAHQYNIENKSWENTIAVDRDDLADDNVGVYRPLIQNLAMDAAQHPDELVFDLIKAGETELAYDGQPFFDTDHPVLDENGAEQSVSNTGGGGGTPWYLLDLSRPIKPIILQKRKDYEFAAQDNPDDESVFMRKQFIYGVDGRGNVGFGLWQLAYLSKQTLNNANYAAARTALAEMKGDNGKPLGVKGTHLLVPPSLEEEAHEVLTAERQANGATNVHRGTAELIVSPWLA